MTSDYSTISFECARHHWLQRIEFTSDDNAKGGKLDTYSGSHLWSNHKMYSFGKCDLQNAKLFGIKLVFSHFWKPITVFLLRLLVVVKVCKRTV